MFTNQAFARAIKQALVSGEAYKKAVKDGLGNLHEDVHTISLKAFAYVLREFGFEVPEPKADLEAALAVVIQIMEENGFAGLKDAVAQGMRGEYAYSEVVGTQYRMRVFVRHPHVVRSKSFTISGRTTTEQIKEKIGDFAYLHFLPAEFADRPARLTDEQLDGIEL